jgi:SNF family Na+-dependent transporter
VAEAVLGSGNNGLTFIWVPQIFETLPFGRALTVVFFLALAFAAISSLIAMIELATRVLVDGGMTRGRRCDRRQLGFLLGIPSAVSMAFFDNQDWVWGVGLMLSGLFFAFAVIRFGVRRFREMFINTADSDIRIGRWLRGRRPRTRHPHPHLGAVGFRGVDGRDYAYTGTWGGCRGCIGDRMYAWDVTDPRTRCSPTR